jgi:hypothetical protein
MNRNRIIIVLCLVVLTAGALSFKSFGRQSRGAEKMPPPQVRARSEYALYRSFFDQVNFLKRKADELDEKGLNGSGARTLMSRQTGLSEAQMQLVEQIINDCREEVKQQDEKAMKVSEAYRARVRNGPTPDGYLPAPPAELKAMQEERNAMFLRARDRIRETLGEEDFRRLDDFVMQHGRPGTNKVNVAEPDGQANR